MRRIRLAILGSSPCHACTAACCKQNGNAYSVLLQGESERRKFAAFSIDVAIEQGGFVAVERVVPYRDGVCRFLGADDRCDIYDDRPRSCSEFECVSGYHLGRRETSGHSPFLQRNAAVRQMLDEL